MISIQCVFSILSGRSDYPSNHQITQDEVSAIGEIRESYLVEILTFLAFLKVSLLVFSEVNGQDFAPATLIISEPVQAGETIDKFCLGEANANKKYCNGAATNTTCLADGFHVSKLKEKGKQINKKSFNSNAMQRVKVDFQ